MRGVDQIIIFLFIFMKNQSQLESDPTKIKINDEKQEKESSDVKIKKQLCSVTIDASKIKNILDGQGQGEDQESNEQQIQNKTILQKQLKTNYPYTLKEINHKFKQKHIQKQRTYNMYESKLKIKDYLQTMYTYGYDFKYVQWVFKQKQQNDRYWKEMRRKAYIRMECDKCKENGKKRRWTSILGCVEIRFKVRQLKGFFERFPNFLSKKSIKQELRGMKYQKIVQWELKVYREKCNRCNNWGKTYIYEKQLQAVAMSFCWILAQIMENNPRPQRTKDDRNKIREVHKHDESRCEACLKGKCFNIPKQAEGKKTN